MKYNDRKRDEEDPKGPAPTQPQPPKGPPIQPSGDVDAPGKNPPPVEPPPTNLPTGG